LPGKICGSCGEKKVIPQRDLKYLLDFADFICSKECLVSKIKSFYVNLIFDPDNKYNAASVLDVYQLNNAYSAVLGKAFKSTYEVDVAEFLNSSSFNFLYEPYSFQVGKHQYTPDFYIKPPYDCFIEVRGSFGLGHKKEKLRSFIELYPDINYIFVPWTMREDFINADG
jgi:hypothetical protein